MMNKEPCSRINLRVIRTVLAVAFAAVLLGVGCGGFFNPAFVNTLSGGQFPLTPGPEAAFVFVRAVNETGENAEFIITIERLTIERDDEGEPLVDDSGNVITRPTRETVNLNTFAQAPSNELGVLFSCQEEPINVVGLGENLLPTDSALFLGGQGTGGIPGFGIPAAGIPPLVRQAGNFACGDTIIFRAIRSTGVAGGVVVNSFLLPGFEQPSIFTGPNTFVNLERFLESQTPEDD